MNANDEAIPTGGSPVETVPEEVDVAVVGAGPTGMTMAGMLAAYGVRTVVLDGADGPAPTRGRPWSTPGRWRPVPIAAVSWGHDPDAYRKRRERKMVLVLSERSVL